MVDVSIIIPVYNAGSLINRCLDSVFNQIGDYNIEVILIDDGSTDNSVEIIKQRVEQDRIRLFQQSNSGPSKARNKGISEATGKYLAFIDADDYWMPDFLQQTISFLDKYNECVAVTVAQRHVTLNGQSESPKNWNNITHGKSVMLPNFFEFWGKYSHVCTGSILIHTKIAKQIGGMREDLRSCEDLEFWAMVATKGKMGYIPKILFVSDGNKVTAALGWAKYKARFQATISFKDWFRRLAISMNPKDIEFASSLFNNVVLGITRSFICAGNFSSAYDNLKYYKNLPQNNHYILKASTKGKFIWNLFCVLYLSYRYLKISKIHFYQKFKF